MAVPVTINDIDFNTDLPDAGGVVWSTDITAGWDAAELDQELLATLTDGSALGNYRRRHRTIVCEGTVVAKTDEAHWAAYNRLNALVGMAQGVPLIVSEPTPKLVTVVTGPGSPRIRTRDGRSFEFQLTLVALDPRKYALDERTYSVPAGGVMTVVNAGNSPSPVTVTTTGTGRVDVTAGMPGDARLRTIAGTPIPGGVVFDPHTRTVTYAGQYDYFPALAAGFEWPALPVGTGHIYNDGTAPITATFRDAWI